VLDLLELLEEPEEYLGPVEYPEELEEEEDQELW